MAEQVLVLGVGNILFSDEAIGVRTVEHLQQCASLPGNVELMDGGTLGIRLMDAIMGCDLLIVVDAVLGGGEPGTLYRLEGEGLRASMSFRDSMHQTD
ncbi:MAG: hydrogenase maturation protease, partial [Bilophila wadsworthia]